MYILHSGLIIKMWGPCLFTCLTSQCVAFRYVTRKSMGGENDTWNFTGGSWKTMFHFKGTGSLPGSILVVGSPPDVSNFAKGVLPTCSICRSMAWESAFGIHLGLCFQLIQLWGAQRSFGVARRKLSGSGAAGNTWPLLFRLPFAACLQARVKPSLVHCRHLFETGLSSIWGGPL